MPEPSRMRFVFVGHVDPVRDTVEVSFDPAEFQHSSFDDAVAAIRSALAGNLVPLVFDDDDIADAAEQLIR